MGQAKENDTKLLDAPFIQASYSRVRFPYLLFQMVPFIYAWILGLESRLRSIIFLYPTTSSERDLP